MTAADDSFQQAVRRLLVDLDPDPDREGLRDTPKRVEKVGNADRWYYEAGYVTIGPSGKVVEIKQ